MFTHLIYALHNICTLFVRIDMWSYTTCWNLYSPHACIHIYTYAFMHIYIYTFASMHIHSHIYVYIDIYVFTCIRIWIIYNTCTQIQKYVYIHISIYIDNATNQIYVRSFPRILHITYTQELYKFLTQVPTSTHSKTRQHYRCK